MGDNRNKGGGQQPQGIGAGERWRGGSDELWLEHKVRDMYQNMVEEPVPTELLEVVKRIPGLDD